MRFAFLRIFLVVSILTACAPNPTDVYSAIAAIDAAWKTQNDQVLAVLGRRDFRASRYQTLVAAQRTVEKLGGTVQASDPVKGSIEAVAAPTSLLTAAEWETVKAADTPLLRYILQQHIGILGMAASLDAIRQDVLANVSVSPGAGGSTEVQVSFQMRLRPGAPSRIGTTEAAPTAVRIVMNKFWANFGGELSNVLADRSIPPALSASPTNPPNVIAQPSDATPVGAEPASATNHRYTVPLTRRGGTLSVPVMINNTITLNFIIDTGASDVSVPADVVLTLIRTGTIRSSDFVGTARYQLADGTVVPSTVFRIHELRVGEATLDNVTASVASVSGPLLLGQSFLSRFTSWSIDNRRQVLLLN